MQPWDFPKCKARNHWHSVNPHFQDILAMLSQHFCLERQPIFWVWVNVAVQAVNFTRCMARNRWRSVDVDFYDTVPRLPQAFLPTEGADSSSMGGCCCTVLALCRMRGRTLLTLHQCSFSGHSSNCVAGSLPRNAANSSSMSQSRRTALGFY